MVTDGQMVRMQIHIGLGNDLESARTLGLVKTAEEETMYLRLEKEVREIQSMGGSPADFGDASWTDDWE